MEVWIMFWQLTCILWLLSLAQGQDHQRAKPQERLRFHAIQESTGDVLEHFSPTEMVVECTKVIANSDSVEPVTRARAFEMRGIANLKLQKLDSALSDFREAVRLDKKATSVARHNLISLLNNSRKFEEARAEIRAAQNDFPDDGDFLVDGAVCALNEAGADQIERALPLFGRAIKLDPNCLSAYYYRSQVYFGSKRYRQALADIDIVISKAPYSRSFAEHPYIIRASCLHLERRLSEALSNYGLATKIDANCRAAWLGLFMVYRDMGKQHLALTHVSNCAARFPGDPGIEAELLEMHGQLGLFESGDALAQRISGRKKANSYSFRALGVYAMFKGDFAESAVHLERSLELDPDDERAAGFLALLLSSCPEPKIRNEKRGVEIASRLSESSGVSTFFSLTVLAKARAAIKDFGEATKVLDAVVKLPRLTVDETNEINNLRQLFQKGMPFRLTSKDKK